MGRVNKKKTCFENTCLGKCIGEFLNYLKERK